MQTIDLNETVYELVKQYPELGEILSSLGLDGVTNPLLLKTAGKKMTLARGLKMKKIPMEELERRLRAENLKVKADE